MNLIKKKEGGKLKIKLKTYDNMIKFYNRGKLPDHYPLKRGNRKIGLDTVIMNFETSLFCSANEKNLCNHRDICYALRSELRYYHSTLKYRHEQELFFQKNNSLTIAKEIEKFIEENFYNIKYVRFSESGDFPNQKSFEKLNDVCKRLPYLIFYGYTSRKDLDFSSRRDNLIINGSGFMVDNSFSVVKQFQEDDLKCLNNCRMCDLCKVKKGNDIKVLKH